MPIFRMIQPLPSDDVATYCTVMPSMDQLLSPYSMSNPAQLPPLHGGMPSPELLQPSFSISNSRRDLRDYPQLDSRDYRSLGSVLAMQVPEDDSSLFPILFSCCIAVQRTVYLQFLFWYGSFFRMKIRLRIHTCIRRQ